MEELLMIMVYILSVYITACTILSVLYSQYYSITLYYQCYIVNITV